MSYSATLEARARCRRDGLPLATVEFSNAQGERETVSEAPYDALGLARALVFNGRRGVVYTSTSGIVYRDEQIKSLGY